ncbi:LysR family transcriptional regulator [Sphingomonas hankookensis]|uniref:LysR family transcriptional regulator n=1 Tax=Sphingomonas hankookensis TaxID=563996 RepID=UPI00262A3175|nr:LysR family transcriptional regulator [uncultured Sphingomonas sp.]
MDWNDVRYFAATYRAGSLTGAARMLGVSVQTVGRRIDALETAIGSTLFVRHSGGYTAAPDAEALMAEAVQVEEAMASFRARASGRAETISGVVRLAAPETITTHLLLPALPAMLSQYPQLELEIITGIAPVGIARGEADLALRLVPPDHGALTVRRIGTMRHGLYAGAGSIPDLAASRLVGWTDDHDLPASRWLYRLAGRSADLRFNHLEAHRAAIVAGLGVGILPCFLDPGLSRLPCTLLMEEPVWLVGHAAAEMSVRVRVVYDEIAAIIAANADLLTGRRGTREQLGVEETL